MKKSHLLIIAFILIAGFFAAGFITGNKLMQKRTDYGSGITSKDQPSLKISLIPFRIIDDHELNIRDAADNRYSAWTADPSKVLALCTEFGIAEQKVPRLDKGEIFAIYLNDNIEEELVEIISIGRPRGFSEVVADYIDSGTRHKLSALEAGEKYTHLTAVVFKPEAPQSHLRLRAPVHGYLSDIR